MRRRSGFTLVEVLVSMALILFIMSILAGAFGAASQAVSDLKAAGDLAEKLRGATNVLKHDLEEPHFYDGTNGSATARLSDPSFWTNHLIAPSVPTGFFRIYQGQRDVREGGPPAVSDLDNIPSYLQPSNALASSTALHYTIALSGTRRSDFLSALVPPGSPLTTLNPLPPSPSPNDLLLLPIDARYQDTANIYNSQYAEVAVFLGPTGDVTDSTSGPAQPLFALYRRQFLTVPPGWGVPRPAQRVLASAANKLAYLEVSARPTAGEISAAPNITFNTMVNLTQPINRFWMIRAARQGAYQPLPAGVAPPLRYPTMGEVNGLYQAADLLMTDVLSFDVRLLVKGQSEFLDLYDLSAPALYPSGNPNYIGANRPRVFDTWSNTAPYANWMNAGAATTIPMFKDGAGNMISVQAIQITLRVWDFKTKKTRQVTIVQQM